MADPRQLDAPYPALRWLGALAVAAAFVRPPAVPLAEGALAVLLLVVVVGALRLRQPLPGTGPFALAASLLVVLSLRSHLAARGALEAAQTAGLLCLGVLAFASLARGGWRHALRWGMAGWAATVLVALGQYFGGWQAADIGGLLWHRALYGTLVAASLPLWLAAVCEGVPERRQMLAWLLGILGAGLSVLYLPAFALLLAGVAASAVVLLRGHRRGIALAAAGIIVLTSGLGLTPRSNRDALIQSVAARDADGVARRWVLELEAGLRAVADRPWLGHGPGRYQATVSSGQYREFLPPTAENRVEPGTQCGYLVLAVESGVPAALLVLVAFLAGAWRAWRWARAASDGAGRRLGRALSLSLLLLAVGMGFTPLLVQGPGVLACAALGLALGLSWQGDAARSRPAALPAQAWFQWGLLALAGCVVLLVARPQEAVSPGLPDPPAGAGELVVLEPGLAGSVAPPFEALEDANASGGKGVRIPDVDAKGFRDTDAVSCDFELARGGDLRLWVRAWWQDGCSNSVGARVDDSPVALVGNDGTYHAWHWVAGPAFALAKGRHRLDLVPREPNVRIDQVLLASDPAFYPSGIVAAASVAKESPALSVFGDVPALASEERPARPPFVVGVGGAYRGGWESMLTALGVPCVRLRDVQLSDPKALAGCGVVCLSGIFECGTIGPALKTYVENGGALVAEAMQFADLGREGRLLFSPAAPAWEFRAVPGRTVKPEGSPFFKGIRDGEPIYDDVANYYLPSANKPPDLEMHGGVTQWAKPTPALMKKRFGKGTLYYFALPVALASMWRGPRFDPVGKAVLLDAIAGRYSPLYAELKWNPPPEGTVRFADDFMCNPGDPRGWEMENGQWDFTGLRPRDPAMAFTYHGKAVGEGPCRARTGQPNWRAYRIAASLLVGTGAGGVWLTTDSGRRFELVLDGEAKRLSLMAKQDGALRELAGAPAPPPHDGWRRISLCVRDRAWQCGLDGEPLFTAPTAEEVMGRCGLQVSRGEAWFDDVRVCDAALLVPGTDRCPGEDGSPRAEPPTVYGLEPRTIYAPQWFLRPDPEGRHAVRIGLPTYADSLLVLDGERLGIVRPDPEGPLVCLPEGRVPQRQIELVCPVWRDYSFGGQLVDWYTTGATWNRRARWSCDRRWEWLGVLAQEPSVLWYRHALAPPYCINVIAAPSDEWRNDRGDPRDLNLVLGGNGKDISAGILIRTGRGGGEGCQIAMGGKVLATAPDFGLPTGHNLHHRWFALEAVVEPKRVRFYYERQLVFDCPLPEPLPAGQVGFWTRNNDVRLARATLSLSQP